ncbi:Nucleotide-binding universal stress protein, UspA family [Actinacidiphila yanglinensis]|uniref:Nucleotide-binding universal stress protein, UspA family n=1 Tax=Actinacidiphila yanglinensis TaxID=310779 RepID=A0A1H6DQP1_9ACTN|nr:universal stress protein [Actinacidiphila yanglinensis]SEG87561.1 Nucleotide-binding universal stress protein, UspA family [Actinacidiphila yanglinensis]
MRNGAGEAVVAGVARTLAPVHDHVIDWAADEAVSRGLPMRLLHAQKWPHGGPAPTGPGRPGRSWSGWSRHFPARGRLLLTDARDTVRARHHALKVTTELAAGRPTRVLREAAGDAALLVLGARRFTSIADTFAGGSTAMALVGQLPCPVALVPERSAETPGDAPVVVGVDGSAAARSAVELAFFEAAAAKVGLVAVEVRPPGAAGAPEFLETSLLEMSELLAGFHEKYPDTEVSHEILTGDAGPMLATAARHARCLVVGSRGRDGSHGMLLGSTSRSLVHGTHCPLLVAAPVPAV